MSTSSSSPQGTSANNQLNPLGHHNSGHASADCLSRQEANLVVERQSGNVSDSKSVASERRSRFRTRVSRFFKGKPRIKESATFPAVTEASQDAIQSDGTATPIPVGPFTPPQPGGASIATALCGQASTAVPVIQVRRSTASHGQLRIGIFPKNVPRPVFATDLPAPGSRIDKTTQLAYCCSLIPRTEMTALLSVSDGDDIQVPPLDKTQRDWMQEASPNEREHRHWLIDQLIKTFSDDTIKGPAAVTEIVLVSPVLDRDTYRTLLSCFITKFEKTTPLDLTLLQGLVQVVENAPAGYLIDNDLDRIVTVLSKELSVTYTGASNRPLYLIWALSRIVDVMSSDKVKDLNRDRDHQPTLQLLDELKESSNIYLNYQAEYVYQALQYVPDDETPLQALWRYIQMTAPIAPGVASVFELDPTGFLEGIEHLQQIGGGVADVINGGVDSIKAAVGSIETIRGDAGREAGASEQRSDFLNKRSWYIVLQGTALYIRQGRLADFNQVTSQAACRHDANFQFGICRQLGEIAANELWDALVRQQAVEFLGELYQDDLNWKPHANIKQWILAILDHILELSNSSTMERACALLKTLRRDGSTPVLASIPLAPRLPIPTTFPLLAQIQDLQEVEYTLLARRRLRMRDYRQAVYIAPMAKPSLQAKDKTLFPLMERVLDFLAGDGQVMLILGDSGAGKSTFNRNLEYQLWQDYKSGGAIPLFINLPALERPKQDLVAEQLRTFDLSPEHIQELKKHRQFVLICDGYDESQLACNLHTTNLLNQPGQWKAKLIVACRSQFLGQDYRNRFVPKAANQYHRAANDLFQEAVIAPFTRGQIEDYVERYISLEPRAWDKNEYMDKLVTIPNLLDLVKNPFLLTLCLEALPNVVQGKSNLSRLRVTRVQLYDTFVNNWLGANKSRTQDLTLSERDQTAFNELMDDGFERSAIDFQKNLAAAIFLHQEGKPIVDYTPKDDKKSWKAMFFSPEPDIVLLRNASLLSRAGSQYRFIHRSILEYFYSCTVCPTSANTDELAPQAAYDFTATLSPIADHPLSQRNLANEPSVVLFLSERVQVNTEFKQHLFTLLERSKKDEHASQAAANAITILVRAGILFNGADLCGIRIPKADLSGGQFDAAQFQGANLEGVNLAQCWIRKADLRNVQMKGAQFGELSYLEVNGEVGLCAYSSDCRILAVGLASGDINMYDTATWTIIRTCKGHGDPVKRISFLPSNVQLLSGNSDGTVTLWDCETEVSEDFKEEHFEPQLEIEVRGLETEVEELKGIKRYLELGKIEENPRKARNVAFSPCGTLTAFVRNGLHMFTSKVMQWNTQTRTSTSFSFSYPIAYIAYSPDSSRIAVAGWSGTVRIFDIQTGLLTSNLGCEQRGSICRVMYSPDGKWIVTGSSDGTLQLCDARNELAVYKWLGHDRSIWDVNFSSNSQWIASCSWDKSVKLWSADTRSLVSVFLGHSDLISSVVFSPDGSHLVTGSYDKTVRFWEIGSLEADLCMQDPSTPATSVAYSSDGQHLVFGSKDGSVRVCNADTGESELVVSSSSTSPINCVAFSPDGLRFAGATNKGCVTFWDATGDSADIVLDAQNQFQFVTPRAFSHCGRWIVTSSNNTSHLWDTSSGQLGQILTGHTRSVTSVAFSPNGRHIVSGSSNGSIRIWEIGPTEPREIVTGTDRRISTVAYSPVASQIAASFEDVVQIWDEQSGSSLQCLEQTGYVSTFAFSSCGSWIAVGSYGFVSLWNYGLKDLRWEWRQAVVVKEFIGNVVALAWKPSKLEFVVTCSEDKASRVWRLQDELGKWAVYLVWSSGAAGLVADGALIVNAIGLSMVTRQFLKQRGALDESSFAMADSDGDEELLLPEDEPEPSTPSEASDSSDTSSEEDWDSEDFQVSDAPDAEEEEDEEVGGDEEEEEE